MLGTAERIAAARVESEGAAGRTLRDTCPVEEPRWDNHTAEGRELSARYLGIIVEAMGKAVPRVTNLSELYEVRQRRERGNREVTSWGQKKRVRTQNEGDRDLRPLPFGLEPEKIPW